jgi:hypothetical protein
VDYRPNFTIRQELTNGLALENGAMVESVPAFGKTPVRFYRITAPQKFSAGASPLPLRKIRLVAGLSGTEATPGTTESRPR